ncbi:MAG: sensor histidine kinase [Anaerolineae bacterium]
MKKPHCVPGRMLFHCSEEGGLVGMILHIPVDRELGERVSWLIKVRWIVLLFGVGLALIANHWLRSNLPLTAIWIVLGIVLAYNCVFWAIVRRLASLSVPFEKHTVLLHMQVIADLVALTAVLHFTGGLENPFFAYYVLLVVIGSILSTRRASFGYALVASVLWVGLLLAESDGLLPHYNLVGYRLPTRYAQPEHIITVSFVLVSLNLAVAFFSSGIIRRLREGERQLLSADHSCEIRARELARLNERLRELDRSRSLFIRLVTHELRAPVAAIQSYLRLILDGYVPAERLTEIVTRAEQRARDQLELIGDLLDLARAQDPQEITPPSAVDITAILRDVIDLMQVRAQEKKLQLDVKVNTDVPAVLANMEQVKQVWINLISNAIKYTPEGGLVNVFLEAAGTMVRGTVRDTGIGMAPEEQTRIFEPFYRTETAKATSPQGTGLGLSIVKGIVDCYGGRMWVESIMEQGSTFCFELPQAE